MRKGVFYFEFSNNFEVEDSDDIECVYYGFNMNMLNDDLEEDLDWDYEDFCADMECKFGTHDWSSSPHDDVAGIGYSAYEAPFSTIPDIMEKWRAYLESRADVQDTTAVVQIDITVDEAMKMTDLDFYNYIEGKLT